MYELIATIGMIFYMENGELKQQVSKVVYESRAECIKQHIEGDAWFQENFTGYAGFACVTGPAGDLT